MSDIDGVNTADWHLLFYLILCWKIIGFAPTIARHPEVKTIEAVGGGDELGIFPA